jgi:predicted RNase H-like HicB family nuclease
MKTGSKYNAVYTKSGKWYLGWVEELPGVNTQGKTLAEVKANLREALFLILETNRLLSRKNLPSTKLFRESIFA